MQIGKYLNFSILILLFFIFQGSSMRREEKRAIQDRINEFYGVNVIRPDFEYYDDPNGVILKDEKEIANLLERVKSMNHEIKEVAKATQNVKVICDSSTGIGFEYLEPPEENSPQNNKIESNQVEALQKRQGGNGRRRGNRRPRKQVQIQTHSVIDCTCEA